MFGGLALCSLEVVVAKDGSEHIIEVNDCALPLMGDTQEDDRRYMAELVATKMQVRAAPSCLHVTVQCSTSLVCRQ